MDMVDFKQRFLGIFLAYPQIVQFPGTTNVWHSQDLSVLRIWTINQIHGLAEK